MTQKTNPNSTILSNAVIAGAGLSIPPEAMNIPDGMGAIILLVPVETIMHKNPEQIQSDMGIPFYGKNISLFPVSRLILNKFSTRFCKIVPHFDNDGADCLYMSLYYSHEDKDFKNGECITVTLDRERFIDIRHDAFSDVGTALIEIIYSGEDLNEAVDAVEDFFKRVKYI